jgi:hypothetical protein
MLVERNPLVSRIGIQNPPSEWKPAGSAPSATQSTQRDVMDYTLAGALKTWQ